MDWIARLSVARQSTKKWKKKQKEGEGGSMESDEEEEPCGWRMFLKRKRKCWMMFLTPSSNVKKERKFRKKKLCTNTHVICTPTKQKSIYNNI